MAIVYPLKLPSTPAARTVTFRGRKIAGLGASPYTGQQQVQEWPGEWWEADLALPIMAVGEAEPWLATLLALRGPVGTFMWGDSTWTQPRGSGGANILPHPRDIDLWADYTSGGAAAPTITSNAANDPWGTLTAEMIVFPATSGTQRSGKRLTVTPSGTPDGRTFTYSIWLRAVSAQTIRVWIAIPGSSPYVQTSVDAAVTSSWQRFSVTATIQAGCTSLDCFLVNMESQVAKTVYAACGELIEGQPFVDGAQLAGAKVLNIDGLKPSTAGLLLAGDYVQVGNRLHMLLNNCNSDSNGKASLDIFPCLREAPADGDFVELNNPRGLFRLVDGLEWSLDEALKYGINFKAVEAI